MHEAPQRIRPHARTGYRRSGKWKFYPWQEGKVAPAVTQFLPDANPPLPTQLDTDADIEAGILLRASKLQPGLQRPTKHY